jgi:hypothetical protein
MFVKQDLKTVEMYDTFTNQWHDVAPMHFVRSAAGVCVVNGDVVVVGGCDGKSDLSSCESYEYVLRALFIAILCGYALSCVRGVCTLFLSSTLCISE